MKSPSQTATKSPTQRRRRADRIRQMATALASQTGVWGPKAAGRVIETQQTASMTTPAPRVSRASSTRSPKVGG